MTSALVITAVAVALLVGVISYVRIAWRQAPLVLRAMSLVVLGSVVAGFLLAIPVMHWIGDAFVWSAARASSASGTRLSWLARGGCPAAGIPASELGKAMVLADERHAGDPNWIPSSETAQMCKSYGLPMSSEDCVPAFIARHALGQDLSTGDRRRLIPCEEVAGFCDYGWLAKDSTFCLEAYATRNARMQTVAKKSTRTAQSSPAAIGTFRASAGAESAAGIPTGFVVRALFAQELKHSGDASRQSWHAVADDCRLGLKDRRSLLCQAAVIEEDEHGYYGYWKQPRDVLPYGLVTQFCEAGYLDKRSKVCVAAYRFGSKTPDK